MGSDDLSAWTLDIDKVTRVIIIGLPALPFDWQYRTFRTPGFVSPGILDLLRPNSRPPPDP